MKVKVIVIFISFFIATGSIFAQEPQVFTLEPGQSITDVIWGVYPGDIIELAEGVHNMSETVVIPLDLIVRSVEGATVIWEVPSSIDEAIRINANVRFEHIIFRKDTTDIMSYPDLSDASCIRNIYGSVTDGLENEVNGNNIFIDHCQFMGFYKSILLSDARASRISHPVDTLYITNCLFYGAYGLKLYPRAIHIWHRQARNVKIQNCTFWHYRDFGSPEGNTGNEAMHINGFGYAWDDLRINTTPCLGVKYMKVLVDHCTFYLRGSVGIFFEYPDENDTLSNNVFQGMGGFAIKAEWCSMNDSYIDYNIAHHDVGNDPACSACGAWHPNLTNIGSHCQVVDPKFVNPEMGDFRYQTGSHCIGTGSDGSDIGNPVKVWKPGTWDHTPPTGVEKNSVTNPTEFNLVQNYPNPFNPATTISYMITRYGHVTLDIYNIKGHKMRSLVNNVKDAGTYSEVWDGFDDKGMSVSAGIYFCRLHAGSIVKTRKMVLMK